MDFLIAALSDKGIKKEVNQDCALVKVANSKNGKICLAVVCDGMGGLEKGELASSAVIRTFNNWFEKRLPKISDFTLVKKEWMKLIQEENKKIRDYGIRNQLELGTTITVILFIGKRWYAVNVGDSRIYELKWRLRQLTKDQTFVQREMDLGHLTLEETLRHPKRSVLLQCIGSESVIPEFFTGKIKRNALYLLCSDGFRHTITQKEIYHSLRNVKTQEELEERLAELIELNKKRKETDNITAIGVKMLC